MTKSIFENFDPELYSMNLPSGCDNLRAVFDEANGLCVKWIVGPDGGKTWGEYLTNDEYHALEKRIEALAEVGFKERASFTPLATVGTDRPSPEFRDYSTADWAAHGKNCTCPLDDEITFTQIYAFGTLYFLDKAITAANEQKALIALDNMSMAASHLAAATEEYADTCIKNIAGNSAINLEAEFKDRRRKMAALGAKVRHSIDPKQRDKSFVYECWIAWQAKPEQYKGKAAFARSMVEKCEHLQSTKVVEDWCRAWDAAKKV